LAQRLPTTFTGFEHDFENTWAELTPERRRQVLEDVWQHGSLKLWLASFAELFSDQGASEQISEFVREKMRARLKDPRLCDILIPKDSKSTADAILNRVVTSDPRVPSVVAMVTDRERNIYEGAAGKKRLDLDADMTTDTVFRIWSTTKAITGTAALQLVEEGRLDLDAPAKTYAPDIGKLQVIEGFSENGEPRLRPPKRDVTSRMLLLHTAGMGYDFFNETYNRLAQEKGQPSVVTASKKALRTPLLFDPGDRWEYGKQHGLVRPGDRRHHRQPARRGLQGSHL
jgi:CubicO group peptidase (beta-lactamase class C family)